MTVPPLTSLTTMAPVPANTRANVPKTSAASFRIRLPSQQDAARPVTPARSPDLFHQAPRPGRAARTRTGPPAGSRCCCRPGGTPGCPGRRAAGVGWRRPGASSRREAARSVTHSSSARTRACRSRSRVSFASTLNTAASPPAWIGDISGRSFRVSQWGSRWRSSHVGSSRLSPSFH